MKKSKKCKKCNVPLEGIGYKLIGKPLFKIMPSKKKKNICNRCEKN